MSDEITLHGKTYVPSRRAAEESSYAQDYIGQLARAGLIEAERVGGLWYVTMESLNAYKENSIAALAAAPVPQPASATRESDTLISFDGRDYISASRASKITGYNQDYIGQLARAGKILSRQVGNRWYVDREGLEAHKLQKDAMLASVQAESTGVVAARVNDAAVSGDVAPHNVQDAHLMHYFEDNSDLMPSLGGAHPRADVITPTADSPDSGDPIYIDEPEIDVRPAHVPIRIVEEPVRQPRYAGDSRRPSSWTGGVSLATRSVFALTVVVVLMYGFVSIRNGSIYSYVGKTDSVRAVSAALAAGAAPALGFIGDVIEDIVSPVITYTRN